jgi:hypothetical protein
MARRYMATKLGIHKGEMDGKMHLSPKLKARIVRTQVEEKMATTTMGRRLGPLKIETKS